MTRAEIFSQFIEFSQSHGATPTGALSDTPPLRAPLRRLEIPIKYTEYYLQPQSDRQESENALRMMGKQQRKKQQGTYLSKPQRQYHSREKRLDR